MTESRYIVVRVFLWTICVYHMVAGIAATFFKEAAVKLGSLLFGVVDHHDAPGRASRAVPGGLRHQFRCHGRLCGT